MSSEKNSKSTTSLISEKTSAGTEPEYKFKSSSSKEIKERMIAIHKKHNKKVFSPDVTEGIKKELDNIDPSGWVVFGGMHMAGSCSYVQGTLVEFEYEGVSYVIFKTYVPNKN